MTFTDLFPLIKLEEQVLSGTESSVLVKNMHMNSDGSLVYFGGTADTSAEKGIFILFKKMLL